MLALPAERQLGALMDRLWDEQRRRFPETLAGTPIAGPIPTTARHDSWSRGAREDWVDWARQSVRRVEAIDGGALPLAAEIDRAVLLDHFGQIARLGSRYRFGASPGDAGAPVAPFAVSPVSGPHRRLRTLLLAPPTESASADVREVWREQLAAMPHALDSATQALRSDASAGISPARALIDATVAQLAALQAWATAPFAQAIGPALERQTAALDGLRAGAGDAVGVWALRDGEAFYADALAWHTGVALTPDDAHALGRRRVATLSSALDAALARTGLTRQALAAAPLADAVGPAGPEAPIDMAALAPIRRYGLRYAGHAEGWSLYAAAELARQGAWSDDAPRRLRVLHAQLRAAARLLADTGLHVRRWTPAQAAAVLADVTGEAQPVVARSVERMCAAPGLACAGAVGQDAWQRLAALTRSVAGNRFDPADLTGLLRHGPAPFALLERVAVARFTPRRSERDMRTA